MKWLTSMSETEDNGNIADSVNNRYGNLVKEGCLEYLQKWKTKEREKRERVETKRCCVRVGERKERRKEKRWR